MRLRSIKPHLLILLLLMSVILAACDTLTSPDETEESTFEGAPEVIIASPLNGDTYQEGVGINILLRVDNAGPDVARIAIEVDGQIIGEAVLPNPAGDPSFTVNNGWPATGEGAHTITAIASRSDGTVSEEASVTINVVALEMADSSDDDMETDDDDMATDIPMPTDDPADEDIDNDSDTSTDNDDSTSSDDDTDSSQQAVATVAPTNVPATQAPTNTSVPPTSSRPQVTVRTGANVRRGPGLVFDPPIGSLGAGAQANILAVNNAGTWYRIEYYNGDAWISSLVVDVTGDAASLPREAGPATPVPPTPVPPTNTPPPASNVDLFIDAAQSSFVPSFVCAQASQITITVVNAGSGTSTGTNILIQDIQPDGTVGATTETVIGALGANESQTVTAALTVSTFVSESHTFRARVDGNNSVAESNENNNEWTEIYILEPGSC